MGGSRGARLRVGTAQESVWPVFFESRSVWGKGNKGGITGRSDSREPGAWGVRAGKERHPWTVERLPQGRAFVV